MSFRRSFLLATTVASTTRAFMRPAAASRATRSCASTAFDIDATIKESDVVVFSKSYCPFCAQTKNLFKALEVQANVIELDLRDDGPTIQGDLKAKTGQSTVPNVFIKGHHLGGNDDTQQAHKSGKLEEMLAG